MPTVSVVIPTYNRADLVVTALESVLAQTYQDYEIIIVDDGSTDDTVQRLRLYAERIRYFYQDNRGVSSALNKGIEVAKGKWISVLASDDVWLATKLERQFAALTRLGDGFGACFTDCTYHGDPNIELSAFQQAGLESGCQFGALLNPIKYVLGLQPAIYVQSIVVLRSLLQDLNGFDEAMVVAEDTDLLFRLALKTKLCFVSAPLVKIDRTPYRSVGLMEIFSKKDDRAYACREHMWKKWLALPEFTDLETRESIQDNLRLMYYDWTVARLYQLNLVGAHQTIKNIRRLGDGGVMIAATFGARVVRKVRGLLHGQ